MDGAQEFTPLPFAGQPGMPGGLGPRLALKGLAVSFLYGLRAACCHLLKDMFCLGIGHCG